MAALQQPSHVSTSSPAQFTLFPSLPIELRLAIYSKYNTPRIIFISHPQSYRLRKPIFNSTPSPSILLQVCQESRLITLQTQSLAFSDHCRGTGFYFNFRDDALCFQSLFTMKQFFNLPPNTGEPTPRPPFHVERRLRTIICGDGKEEMIDKLDFAEIGPPELVISVRQAEVGNVYQASPEVSIGYQRPDPADIEDMSRCGLKGIQVVSTVSSFPSFDIKFMEMTMEMTKVYLGVSPPPTHLAVQNSHS